MILRQFIRKNVCDFYCFIVPSVFTTVLLVKQQSPTKIAESSQKIAENKNLIFYLFIKQLINGSLPGDRKVSFVQLKRSFTRFFRKKTHVSLLKNEFDGNIWFSGSLYRASSYYYMPSHNCSKCYETLESIQE